ncbi:hypothetical protein ENBRE01_1133 [Enteropsectra breve]|nr:hypothetical protein ENBRE01_1133 [Enteropsectra breve]
MKIVLSELYTTLVHEVGSSFIFGTATSAVKGVLNNNSNAVIKQVQALRKGIENAKYTMVYTTIMYLCAKMSLEKRVSAVVSLFFSSFLIGRRNGIGFSLLNACFGLFFTIVNSMIF